MGRSDRSTLRRAALAIAVVLLTAGAGSCGSGSDSGSDGPAAEAADPEAGTSASDDAPQVATSDQGWVVAFSDTDYDAEELRIATSADGTNWTEVGSGPGTAPILTGLAEGPDGWVGVDGSGTVHTSDDLVRWERLVSLGDHLYVTDLTYADGRYVAVGATSPQRADEASVPSAFWSTDGRTWEQAEVPAVVVANPYPSSPDHVWFGHVTHTTDEGFVANAVNPVSSGAGGEAVTLVSSDGESWAVAGDPHVGTGDLAAGAGVIVTGFITGDLSDDRSLRIGGLGVRAGASEPLDVVAGTPFTERPLSSVAFGDGRFLALGAESFNEGTGSDAHGAFVSTDGRSWDHIAEFQGYVHALAHGSIDVGDADATDPAEPADLRAVDWPGRAYEVCDVSVTLVEGRWEDAGLAVVVNLDQVQYGDADGDGDDDALLSFSCAPLGGNAYPRSVNLVFTSGADAPTQVGDAFPGAQATLTGGGVQTVDPVWAEGDPRSSPSGSTTTVWRFQGGAWVPTVVPGVATDPAPPAPAPPPPPPPAPGGGGSGDLPQVDGYGPVGSGCSPGPGALPDGWWFGYVSATPTAGGSVEFDLACYSYEEMADVEHGHDDVVVTNTNTTLRTVAVAADATFVCSTVLSTEEQTCDGSQDGGVWLRIEGGAATKVVTQLWWE